MIRRFALPTAAAVLLGALAGCASLGNIDNDVSSFSRWPSGRPPATYAFERLPSQQAQPQQQQMLEDSARQAIEGAGFRPAAEGSPADVTVQLGARVTATDRSPFDDPFWYGAWGPFHGPFGFGRYGRYGAGWGGGWRYGGYGGFGYGGYGGFGYGYGPGLYDSPYYEREVAVLIRDKKTGEPLYESSAHSDGLTAGVATILPAMFVAALQGFPNPGAPNPRRISIRAASIAASAPPIAR